MIFPVGVVELVGRIKDRDVAALVAIAAVVVRLTGTLRLCRGGNVVDRREQGWLVALDLDDQVDIGVVRDFEEFF